MQDNTGNVIWWEPAKGMIRKYIVDGIEQKLYLVDTKISKQYAGYRLILKDLSTVKKIIAELRNFAPQTFPLVKQSLTFYAVITYGKCFSEAKGRGVSLNRKEALKLATTDQAAEHDQILHLRNQYVAHSGEGGYEHNLVVAALNHNELDPKVIDIYDNLMVLVDIDTHLEIFDSVVDKVYQYVDDVTLKLKQRMLADLLKEDISMLYANSMDYSQHKIDKMKVDKR